MANSNNRLREPDSVHHVTSRIAHRVYFLEDEERNDLIEMIRRAADFAGLKLLGWCIMTNHFHLLVYVPPRAEIDEDEVLRRYGRLKGESARGAMESSFARWRSSGEAGEQQVGQWLDKQRRRMYDLGCFMKIVKQWFTEDYNSRKSHRGTLWEAVYHDRAVKLSSSSMAKCLAYIHLNPVRAAVCDNFFDYPWSSYSAYHRGDDVARSGMHFIYGDDVSDEEIEALHNALLEHLLESEKLRRAEEIVKRRAAGFAEPADPLTDEALIAQAAAHLEEVKKASMRFQEESLRVGSRKERNELLAEGVLSALRSVDGDDVAHIAEKIGVSARTAYRQLKIMEKDGLVAHEGHGGKWYILSK